MGTGGLGAGRDSHRLPVVMSHELHPWADDRKVAVVSCDAKDDHWALTHEAAWAADIGSFTVKVIDALARMDVMVKSG